jgi:hypothetical protein
VDVALQELNLLCVCQGGWGVNAVWALDHMCSVSGMMQDLFCSTNLQQAIPLCCFVALALQE